MITINPTIKSLDGFNSPFFNERNTFFDFAIVEKKPGCSCAMHVIEKSSRSVNQSVTNSLTEWFDKNKIPAFFFPDSGAEGFVIEFSQKALANPLFFSKVAKTIICAYEKNRFLLGEIPRDKNPFNPSEPTAPNQPA